MDIQEMRSPSDHQENNVPNEEAPQPLDHDQDREYGCRYCDKKFSNKQALGGHQNAHKVERALEKNARDHLQENSLGFSSNPQFLGSYHRSHDQFMNRTYIAWPYPTQHHQVGYGGRPGIPIPSAHYGPRPVFNGVYPWWSQQVPRISHFLGHQNFNPGFRPGSGSNHRPGYEFHAPPGSAGPSRIGPGRINPVEGSGPGNEQVDESGLDLTLKL